MSEQGVPGHPRCLQEGAESSPPLPERCFPWREGRWRVNHANRVGEFGGSERGEDPGGREPALASLSVVPVVSRTSLCWDKQRREAGTAPTSCVLRRGNGLGTWRPRCCLSCGAVWSPSNCQRLSPAAFIPSGRGALRAGVLHRRHACSRWVQAGIPQRSVPAGALKPVFTHFIIRGVAIPSPERSLALQRTLDPGELLGAPSVTAGSPVPRRDTPSPWVASFGGTCGRWMLHGARCPFLSRLRSPSAPAAFGGSWGWV